MLPKALIVTALLTTVALAGCHTAAHDDDRLVLAYTVKDDYDDPDADPQRLADWIAAETGRSVELYPITSDGAAIEAVRFGHAHAAFLDGGSAWIAWKEFGLEAIAADQKGDGRTYYEATPWVLADSPIQTHADLAGQTSCHTGWLKSAGMLMPMGALIRDGHMQVVGDTGDLASIEATLDGFFGEARVPAGSGDPYYNYEGAFRCLSDGSGDVAFVKDSTYDDHCATDTPDWCLDRTAYRMLEPFGRVPSHPVMVSEELPAADRQALVDALLALNDSDEGRSILEHVLNTPGITEVTTEEHLGSYSDAIQHVPGLKAHYKSENEIGA